MIYRDTNIQAARAAGNFNTRRDSSGGRGRRGGSVLPQRAVGIEGFVTSTNYLRTAASNPLTGDAGGFFVSYAVHVLSVPGAGNQYAAHSAAGADGWVSYGVSGLLFFGARNGAGTLIFAPSSTITAGDVGETLVYVGVYDATGGLVRAYRAGAQVGSGTAIVGYTPATALARTAVGNDVTGAAACVWGRVVGLVYGTGIPTAANILDHYAACKSQGGMALMPGTVTNVNRWQAYQNVPAATSWADDISGMVLTKTGTLTSVPFTPRWERASYGVEGFVSSTNYLNTIAMGIRGDASGFYVSLAVHVLSVPSGTTYPMANLSSGSTGWYAQSASGAVGVLFGTGATFVQTPTTAIAAGDVGEVVQITAVYDQVGGVVRLYRAGVEIGSGTAMAPYSLPVATTPFNLGSTNGGVGASPWARIVGVVYGTGIPSAADITAHYNMVKATGFMLPMPNATNVNLWNAETNVPNAATWTDSIGGMVLTKTGTLTTTGFPPVFE